MSADEPAAANGLAPVSDRFNGVAGQTPGPATGIGGTSRVPASPKVGEKLKVSVAAFANLAFLPAVVLLWLLEGPVFGIDQLHNGDVIFFVIGDLCLIVYYGLLAEPERAKTIGDQMMEAARSGIPVGGGGDLPGAVAGSGRVRLFLTNLWTPVTLNFWLVGWLIYATGGITVSPYGGVPLSMIIIGQSVYAVPPIELRPIRHVPRLLVFLWNVGRLYWSSLLVVVSLLGALVLFGHYVPRHAQAAPSGEILLVMLVSLFASMCVTFITRRADQNHRASLTARTPEFQNSRAEQFDSDKNGGSVGVDH